MKYLNTVDYSIICVYFSILIGLGLYLKKRASQSLEDYFLAGRSMPWWALGISGMAAWLDVTGTMIITAFIFLLGPRGLFIEFRGGAVLAAAVTMLWAGKWHRRSQCITGAEWMTYRFGDGPGGRFARLFSAIGAIVMTVGLLAYMVKGVGLFLAMFLPFTPVQCAMILIGVAAIYTMFSGFYGVVFTDIFQSGIIFLAVIAISIMAIMKVGDQSSLITLAERVTGNQQWTTSCAQWHTTMPNGYECYQNLMMFALFYLLRNVFGGMAGGAEPKYFGARNDKDCGKLTFMTVSCIMFRWPLMLAFAILGLFLVRDIFPDQNVLIEAAALIKTYYPSIDKTQWATQLSEIIHHTQNCSPELIAGLQNLLGASWIDKLYLLSYEGTVNPERILPAVVLFQIPMGFRGMILVALIAASMSSFDSTANMTTGLFVRDVYQKFIRTKAGVKELVYVSWAFIAVIVLLAFVFAYTVRSINDIWGWVVMGLGGGLLVPNFLRLYWWRFNGGGFAIGTVVGLIGAIVQRLIFPDLDERLQFMIMMTIGLLGSIIGTYLTQPTNRKILEYFYKTTRPFGLWGELKNTLSPQVRAITKKEHRNDILGLPFALGWQITLFMLPMQLMIHSFKAFGITLVIFIISLVGLYYFWYKHLDEIDDLGGVEKCTQPESSEA